MSIAFLVGLVYWRTVEARLLEQVTAALRPDLGPEGLEPDLRFGAGGSVRVLYGFLPPGWIGSVGECFRADRQLPGPSSSQVVAEYGSGDHKVAVVHEEMLQGQAEFLEAIASCAIASLEYQRVSTALDSSLEEVANSRARISAAADQERRRIERDLHDGAQQQLVTLRLKLGLIAEMIESDPERAAEQLHSAGTRLTDVLDEVRSLARGIYPPLLVDAGVGEALVAAGRRSAVPTRVECESIGRYSLDTESAVYFCCLEALQNAGKHAGGAGSISIHLVESDGHLHFEVRDDGSGFTPAGAVNGGGLTNMHDRMAALGGRLNVISSPGAGTRVLGSVPLTPQR
jgi:signal transduction histidine kinase